MNLSYPANGLTSYPAIRPSSKEGLGFYCAEPKERHRGGMMTRSDSLVPQSLALFDRASQVIPGGIYGHMSPVLTVPGEFPYYAERAEGAHYWDVDGRKYLDWICAYGPIVLGYNHPEVEEAAEIQRRKGNCFNHPAPVMVELAEELVSRVDFASWAVFGKNGSDMTTWSLQVAREFTQRKYIVRNTGVYHGTHAWCTPGHAGLIPEDRSALLEFPWNDVEGFKDLIQRYPNQIAALITGPFHYPAFGDSVLPEEGYFKEIEGLCRKHGILLILDDVRGGFRLHRGGSHQSLGFTPDLICFCKAIGNGHPLSATLGRADLKTAASKVFLTGSYWNSAVPMAAALTNLRVLDRIQGIEHMSRIGSLLMKGLEVAANENGFQVKCSGYPAMPFVRFAEETNFMRQQEFCSLMAREGVFLHPHHNWFVSCAHTEADVLETVEKAKSCYRQLKK